MSRILVTGSRHWLDVDTVREALREYAVPGNVLVSGHCPRGADLIAEIWWVRLGMPRDSIELHPADWNTYGKKAGMVRNGEMAKLGAYICLAFVLPCGDEKCRRRYPKRGPHDSHGTAQMMKMADAEGIPVRRVGPVAKQRPRLSVSE